MSISSYNPERAQKAADVMEVTRGELAPSWVTGLTDQQTIGKWGIQPGALHFMGAYVDALNQIRDTMEHLKDQTADLAASTRGITRDATETDDQAAQRLQTHWRSHTADPAAPGPTGLDTKPVAQ